MAILFAAAFAATAAAQTPPDRPRADWPPPVSDNANYSFLLLDLLECQHLKDADGPRWDFVGWYGGDRRRAWFKSEGEMRSGSLGKADVQALYGTLVSPFFDLQVGGRVERHFEESHDQTRAFAVVALQGLAPYRFEIEPALFISNKGRLSGRFTAAYDVRLAQRLIAQPRFETEIAAQDDRDFGVAAGFNQGELGLRLRYEIRREFAPYAGLAYRHESDALRDVHQRESAASGWIFAGGARVWH